MTIRENILICNSLHCFNSMKWIYLPNSYQYTQIFNVKKHIFANTTTIVDDSRLLKYY